MAQCHTGKSFRFVEPDLLPFVKTFAQNQSKIFRNWHLYKLKYSEWCNTCYNITLILMKMVLSMKANEQILSAFNLIQKQPSLHKKWSFPLRIYSVNVTKSTGNCVFSHLLKKSLMENFIFCAVLKIYLYKLCFIIIT